MIGIRRYTLLLFIILSPFIVADIVERSTIEHLKHLEGFRSTTYWDGSRWAYGYGQAAPSKHSRISQHQAELKLMQEVRRLRVILHAEVKVHLTTNQQVAIICFMFNVGESAFRKSTLLRELNAARYNNIPTQLMRWVYSAGKPILVNRRKYEVGIWFNQPSLTG